jgi:hypothetical protein
MTTARGAPGDQVRRLRAEYPVFRIEEARAAVGPSGVRLEFAFAAGALRFRPTVELAGLSPDEAGRVGTVTAQRMIRALAIVEAFSYWKALCSPVIEVALPAPEPAELGWWQDFWPGAMGEFFYRNQIDYTAPGFLVIRGPAGAGLAPVGGPSAAGVEPAGPPLVLFSGG